MKRFTLFALIALACLAGRAPAQIKDADRVAICGDSITEQKQYTVFMQEYLIMCQPAKDIRTCQFGWSGERGPGFASRMANDVLWFKPTAATTAYGMNDGGYKPYEESTGTPYRDSMRSAVKQFKAAGVRNIVIGSPGCIDPDYMRAAAKGYNPTLAKLRDIAQEVAKEEGVTFANVYDAMLDGMTKAKAKHGAKLVWAGGDGFHPSPNGQLAMAYAFLKALGCDGEIGTITVDLAASKAEATAGHKVLSAAGGAVEVESTRYPFCFSGKADEASTRNAADFIPFNQDLNRFKLVVRNAGAEKLKVTWGGTTKEFAAADLDKGINLAAEFIDSNPFAEQFFKVDQLVRAQQNFETPLHKELLNRLPGLMKLIPEETEGFARIVAAGAKKQKSMSDASSAAVTPVKHVIKIEK